MVTPEATSAKIMPSTSPVEIIEMKTRSVGPPVMRASRQVRSRSSLHQFVDRQRIRRPFGVEGLFGAVGFVADLGELHVIDIFLARAVLVELDRRAVCRRVHLDRR